MTEQSQTSDTALTPDQARAELGQLREDRLAGKVKQSDYFARSEYLSKLEAGEQATPPTVYHSPAEQMEAEQLQALAPPKDAEGYGFISSELSGHDELAELHHGLRKSFFAVELPKTYASAIGESIGRTLKSMEKLPQAAIDQRVQNSGAQLRRTWGDRFEENVKAVDLVLIEMAEADPAVAELVDQTPWVFASDSLVMDLLLRSSQYRARRAQGRHQ